MHRSHVHPLGIAAVVSIGILAISSASILIRLTAAPALSIAAYRVGVASLLLSPRLFRLRRTPPHLSRKPLLALVSAGVFLAAHFALWISSLQWTSVASSVALVSTSPLFAGVLSALLLKERPSRRLWTGILVTLAGSLLVTGFDTTLSGTGLGGDLLALGGAVMAAGYLLAGRLARCHLDIGFYAVSVYATAALILTALCLGLKVPLSGFDPRTYQLLILLGVVPQLIGHTAFNWALRFLPATLVAVLTLGEPIGATFLAWLLLREPIPAGRALGLGVLGIGILISSAARSLPSEPVDRTR